MARKKFNQGDPLDIDALNKLINDLDSIDASIAAAQGATTGLENTLGVKTTGFPVLYAANVPAISITNGLGSAKVTAPASVLASDNPIAFVSLRQNLNKADFPITVSVRPDSAHPNYTIYVSAPKTFSGNVYVAWSLLGHRIS